MLTTPLKFIHIGFGNMLCANKVTGIMPLGSATAKRLIKESKENRQYVDMTSGHAAKSYLLLDDGR